MKLIDAGQLRTAYEEHGNPDGPAAILLHGFPYDPRAYDAVAPALAEAGMRVVVPYLRGYGETRFLSERTPRSGQQAALGADLLALMDALGIGRALLAGYDWSGRAACVASVLAPERVAGLVTIGGYNVQDIAGSSVPLDVKQEHRFWYQYYLHSERGRAGLERDPDAFCRHLWSLWSPGWRFAGPTFAATAASFRNPDFADVVVHSYRHRFGLAAGDPALGPIERRLAARPSIVPPSIVLHGAEDGVDPPYMSEGQAGKFGTLLRRTVVPGAGHNLPQEAPGPVIDAVLEIAARAAADGAGMKRVPGAAAVPAPVTAAAASGAGPALGLDDIVAGTRIALGRRKVEGDEIVSFARAYDPQPFHTDPHAPESGRMSGLIASGWQTVAFAMRMLVDAAPFGSTPILGSGVDELRWPNPVRPGDVLHGTVEFLGTRPSASRPDRGTVHMRVVLENQRGETVLSMVPSTVVPRRPSAA